MFVLRIISLGVFISLYRGVDGIRELTKRFDKTQVNRSFVPRVIIWLSFNTMRDKLRSYQNDTWRIQADLHHTKKSGTYRRNLV